MSTDVVALARDGFDAALRGDLDALGAMLDPDVTWHGGDPSAPGACRGSDEVLRFIRRALDTGWAGRLVDVVDAGSDRVVVVLQPAGGPRRANVTTFRDDRVVEIVAYESPGQALAAAGL